MKKERRSLLVCLIIFLTVILSSCDIFQNPASFILTFDTAINEANVTNWRSYIFSGISNNLNVYCEDINFDTSKHQYTIIKYYFRRDDISQTAYKANGKEIKYFNYDFTDKGLLKYKHIKTDVIYKDGSTREEAGDNTWYQVGNLSSCDITKLDKGELTFRNVKYYSPSNANYKEHP